MVSTDSGVEREARAWELPAYEAYNKGVASHGTSAVAWFREAVRVKPDFPEALMNLGNLVEDEEAAALYERALACADDARIAAQALSNSGYVKHRRAGTNVDRLLEARRDFERAIELAPDFVDARFNFGRLLEDSGESDAAEAQYQTTLALAPAHAKARLNLANVYFARGDTASAAALQAALARDATTSAETRVDALNNLGQAYRRADDHAAAADVFRQALALDPTDIAARANLHTARRTLCLWRDWDLETAALVAAALVAAEQKPRATVDGAPRAGARRRGGGLLPYDAIMLAEAPNAVLRDVAASHLAAKFPLSSSAASSTGVMMRESRSVRFGFLSFDVREHPMGYLTRRLLGIPGTRALSYGEDDGSRIRKMAEKRPGFVDLENATLERVSAASVGLDVVFDLMGHTRGARLDAAHVAGADAVLCAYLGYPGAAGGGRYAYTVADAVVAPVEDARTHFTEKLALFPRHYQANDYGFFVPEHKIVDDVSRNKKRERGGDDEKRGDEKRVDDASPKKAAATIEKMETVCNLNNVDKFEPTAFSAWANVLRRRPGAVLALLEPRGPSAPEIKARLGAELAARGVAPTRLAWWPRVSKARHLARLASRCAVFADNLVYGAHTTAADCLFAGVPIVALRGFGADAFGRFASRVATSLLEASGLPDLALDSVTAFEDALIATLDSVHVLKPRVAAAALRARGALDARAQAALLPRTAAAVAEQRGARHVLVLDRRDITDSPTPRDCAIKRLVADLGDDDPDGRDVCDGDVEVGDDVFDEVGHEDATQRKHRRALDLSSRLAAAFPDDPDARHLRGLALHLAAKSSDEAASELRAATALAPLAGQFWANLGRISGDVAALVTAGRLGSDVAGDIRRLLGKPTVEGLFAASVLLAGDADLGLRVGAALDAAGKGADAWEEWARAVPMRHAAKHVPSPEAAAATAAALAARSTRRPTLAVYCDEYGQTWWPNWGPSSKKTGGLGGAEEAVVFLARELATLGYQVEVYTEPPTTDLGLDRELGDGATGALYWLHHATWDPRATGCDYFVAWRYHISATLAPPKPNARTYVWLQDVPPYGSWTEAAVRELAGVFVLSRFHASTLPAVARPKAIVSPNGIAPQDLVDRPTDNATRAVARPDAGLNPRRNGSAFVYGSAPNRGLVDLLLVWPRIHAATNATLDVYYGLSASFVAWGQAHIPDFPAWRRRLETLLLQKGVRYVGMVDHHALARAYASASFLLYPTTYPETGCVTLMKAMAMGAVPVTSRCPGSVVPELADRFDLGPRAPRTASPDVSISLDPPPDLDWLDAFAQAAIHAFELDRQGRLHQHRADMLHHARDSFLWAHVANIWHHAFSSPPL